MWTNFSIECVKESWLSSQEGLGIIMDLIDSMLESSNQAYQGEDQSKAWLGRVMCNAMVKGKLETRDTMDHYSNEV